MGVAVSRFCCMGARSEGWPAHSYHCRGFKARNILHCTLAAELWFERGVSTQRFQNNASLLALFHLLPLSISMSSRLLSTPARVTACASSARPTTDRAVCRQVYKQGPREEADGAGAPLPPATLRSTLPQTLGCAHPCQHYR